MQLHHLQHFTDSIGCKASEDFPHPGVNPHGRVSQGSLRLRLCRRDSLSVLYKCTSDLALFPGSPCANKNLSILQVTENWTGSGNEARLDVCCKFFKASSVETYCCSNSTICSFLSSYILANGMASTSLMMAWSDLLRFSFPGFSSVNFCHQCFRYREHHVLAGGVSRQTEYFCNHHPPSPQPLPIKV